MTTASCYCRGAGVCDTCNGHACAGHCTCNLDGAPQQQLTSYGHANPSQTRLDAWTARQEARR